ncbi:hypothetical protein LTS15_006540 [Exophiala xenobiotica]|nr:hypothetical protein LTS15_006540 [Exophiala xenobiotica]
MEHVTDLWQTNDPAAAAVAAPARAPARAPAAAPSGEKKKKEEERKKAKKAKNKRRRDKKKAQRRAAKVEEGKSFHEIHVTVTDVIVAVKTDERSKSADEKPKSSEHPERSELEHNPWSTEPPRLGKYAICKPHE